MSLDKKKLKSMAHDALSHPLDPIRGMAFQGTVRPHVMLALLEEIESDAMHMRAFGEVMRSQGEQIDQLKAENEALRKDAKRYRFLRNQHWPVAELAVVCNPKVSVKLGHDCPSGDRLDQQVDGAMIRGASHD
ncbi:hypothetical protein [Pseudomonas monteilii]|uniref:hypothetical protein n=1 Tax=Pseudomonas monteilii TaxID=76759 RepID=UPI0003765AFF|nr:hypothetical protein [Pseudomonas monteilii]